MGGPLSSTAPPPVPCLDPAEAQLSRLATCQFDTVMGFHPARCRPKYQKAGAETGEVAPLHLSSAACSCLWKSYRSPSLQLRKNTSTPVDC